MKWGALQKADNHPHDADRTQIHRGRGARKALWQGADACHVSQPTLSVAIKKLEEERQVKLFERNANEITVTPLNAALSLRT